jgi:hypothetical protein
VPSPLGHALAGAAAGCLLAELGRQREDASASGADSAAVAHPAARRRRPIWIWFALLGAVPDLDLLFGTHNTYSHSAGAVLAAMSVAGLVLVVRRYPWLDRALLLVLAAGAAYASHLLLDWLGTDTSPPVGIMALWPWDEGFYKAPVSWFPRVSRHVLSLEFWTTTPIVAATELVILGPIAWLICRRR